MELVKRSLSAIFTREQSLFEALKGLFHEGRPKLPLRQVWRPHLKGLGVCDKGVSSQNNSI